MHELRGSLDNPCRKVHSESDGRGGNMLPTGRYEPAHDQEVTQCWLMMGGAVAIALWGLASAEPQIYHYLIPPAAILLALGRLKGLIPRSGDRDGEGLSDEYEASHHEPARGFEKVFWRAIIVMAIAVFLVFLLSGSVSWINFAASGGMILIAVARIKGWVRLGGGGIGGGGGV